MRIAVRTISARPRPARSTAAVRPRSAGRGAIGRRAHRCFLTTGAGPFGARVRDPSDRLVKELRLAGITEVEAANAFIRDVYLPAHNARFAVEPASESSAFADPGRRSRRDPVCRRGAAGRQRQLRLLPDLEAANPGEPDASPFRQGAGQGPRLSRRFPRRLSRTTMHRPLRRERQAQGRRPCPARRLIPLGGAPVEMGTTLPRRPQSHRETKPEEADKPRATKTGQLHSLST
jgi:hypothetical protein